MRRFRNVHRNCCRDYVQRVTDKVSCYVMQHDDRKACATSNIDSLFMNKTINTLIVLYVNQLIV